MLGKKRDTEFEKELDHQRERMDIMHTIYANKNERESRQRARDESLRIALITNEINAGRVSETAGIYRAYLIKPFKDIFDGKDRVSCPNYRIKALEHAANIGYVSAEETVEAAREFEKHLSGQNERSA